MTDRIRKTAADRAVDRLETADRLSKRASKARATARATLDAAEKEHDAALARLLYVAQDPDVPVDHPVRVRVLEGAGSTTIHEAAAEATAEDVPDAELAAHETAVETAAADKAARAKAALDRAAGRTVPVTDNPQA